MNLDLEERLVQRTIGFKRLVKAQKVKLLAQWSRAFPDLMTSARHQAVCEGVCRDEGADEAYTRLSLCDFYILPDDDSGMPSYACFSAKPPELAQLVSDTVTVCDELIVVDASWRWSAVFVNHGSPQLVGRHFSRK